jgi:tRNA 2-thiouridine synthesizing protein A
MDGADTVIDGRDMEPPEPFVRTMQALAASGPGQRVLLRLPREPFPLYQALASGGFAWQTERHADGLVEVLMWRK